MATVHEILTEATRRLDAVSESPRLDAELLLCESLGCTRSDLLLRMNDQGYSDSFEGLLQRRLQHEPIAFIVETWEFFSLPIRVTPPTLVPRPETEHLVEWALELLPSGKASAIEVGTGTGCIPIAIAVNHLGVNFTSVDIKKHNLQLARDNARLNNVDSRIEFLESNVFENVGERGPYDLVCSNPPYIPDADWNTLSQDIRDYEDRDALLAGADGLDIVRRIASEAQLHMKPGAHLLLEIGAGQAEAATALFAENGFTDVGFRKDLAGISRVILGRKPA